MATILGPVGRGSPIEAEIWALNYGVQLAKNNHVTNLTIWYDSAIVVGQIGGLAPVWSIWDIWASINGDLRSPGSPVRHIPIKANTTANALSKEGHNWLAIMYSERLADLPAQRGLRQLGTSATST